jgi:CRP/FNR family transcriptional regulator, cyclic AMP receptor protein
MDDVRTSASSGQTIRLLDYDPALARGLRPERLAEARATAEATMIVVPRGARTLDELTDGREAPFGALLLDGLMNRTVTIDAVASAQLLGHGDLVRLGAGRSDALVAARTHWTVIEPLAIALLDERFLLTVRRWPQIVAALFERVAEQNERREIHRALSQLPRVEDRVHALLWLLAERWGRVTPQGVLLGMRLTHELIGQLVGAKRPTVSLALKQLEERGSVHRRAGGWLLEQAWAVAPNTDADGASEGAALVPDLGSSATALASAPLSAHGFIDDVRSRIEQMKRIHDRVSMDVASTLARSTAARERSSSLRERLSSRNGG